MQVLQEPSDSTKHGVIGLSDSILFNIPRDLWPLIIAHIPVSDLGRVACVCKFMLETVTTPSHWRQRLSLLGLLDMFEKHKSRASFTSVTTGLCDWKEYFIAFYLLDRHPFTDGRLEVQLTAEETVVE